MKYAAILFLFLAGCAGDMHTGTNVTAYGDARWPKIPIPPKAEFDAEEEKILNDFASQHQALALKIIAPGKVMRAGLEAYDKARWRHNAGGLRALNYTEEEIVQFLGPDPNKPDSGAKQNAESGK